MPGKDLERTRRYEVGDFPPGTRMLIADRTDLDALLATGTIRAVGRYRELSGGKVGLPAVYVSKRATPFHVRHRIALIVAGSVLILAAGVSTVIVTVGLPWFAVGVVLMAFTIATLSRWANGGGGRHRMDVTVTTRVRTK